MNKANKKKIIIAGLIGGIVFCALMMLASIFILGHEFSWVRVCFYFPFGFLMYSYLAYNSYKKNLKNKE